MKEDVAKAWVADLRNPENKQANMVLFDGNGYCCLGRLCVVSGRRFIRDGGGKYRAAHTRERDVLPAAVSAWSGTHDIRGMPRDGGYIAVNGKDFRSLAEANDNGCTFAEIADAIEANWQRL